MWISKKKYNKLIERIDVLEKRISKFGSYGAERLDKCRDDINNIQRVMEKSKLNGITYMSKFEVAVIQYGIGENNIKGCTYIYKDLKEYKIDGLYLTKPVFTVDDNNNNLIHAKDVQYIHDGENQRKENVEFLIDLQNQTFIRTK